MQILLATKIYRNLFGHFFSFPDYLFIYKKLLPEHNWEAM